MDPKCEIMKLNLGARVDIRSGYINIDYDLSLNEIDVFADVRELPFKNEGVGEIIAQDIIEHISHRHMEKLIQEWYRVLKFGGQLIIITPDFEKIIQLYQERPQGWHREVGHELYKDPSEGWGDIVIRSLFGGQGANDKPVTEIDQGNFHFYCFDKKSIASLLEKFGFRIRQFDYNNLDLSNMKVIAVK